MRRERHLPATAETLSLMKVALGEAEADLAIVNGNIVNVYTGEVLTGDTVLIKGAKIAHVGKNANHAIGAGTRVIDATGKMLVPGFIDGHTHINFISSVSELCRYAMKGGTTAIITEAIDFGMILGYPGLLEFLRSITNQPIKIFLVVPSMATISPIAKQHIFGANQLNRLLRRKEVVGLGESYWSPVIDGDRQLMDFMAATRGAGKKLEGHSAGAMGNKLQAYISAGISSCHEPTTAEEVRERLRLGMFIMVREGETRRELAGVAGIKDEDIDFSNLGLCTDGVGPCQLTTDGYMEFVVQKAIDLGYNPVRTIQMATLNTARHFGLDDFMGGIAPGKYADILVIPDLTTIRPEYVISNGQMVARDGELTVSPRKHKFGQVGRVRLPRNMTADDFAVSADGNRRSVRVRVIDQVTELVTKEAIIELPVSAGQLHADTRQDIIKVAAIERTYSPGKTFTGFIRGIGLKRGAIATTIIWDVCDIIVVGTNGADMAAAVNRLLEIGGGIVVYAGGKVLAEIEMPLGGMLSLEPMETLAHKLLQIQQAAASLGCVSPDIRLSLCVLTTGAIPFLRMCESGIVDLRQNRLVDLMVD